MGATRIAIVKLPALKSCCTSSICIWHPPSDDLKNSTFSSHIDNYHFSLFQNRPTCLWESQILSIDFYTFGVAVWSLNVQADISYSHIMYHCHCCHCWHICRTYRKLMYNSHPSPYNSHPSGSNMRRWFALTDTETYEAIRGHTDTYEAIWGHTDRRVMAIRPRYGSDPGPPPTQFANNDQILATHFFLRPPAPDDDGWTNS